MLEHRSNQRATLISPEQAVTMGDISGLREVLDSISLEITSHLFHQTRLLLLGTHTQLLPLDGKAAQIFPARKHFRTRSLTHSAVMQVHLEVLHLHNMAPRGVLQQDMMHRPHTHRPSIHCLRIPRRHTHVRPMNRRHMHSPPMHHLGMHHLHMQTTHHT